VLFALILVFFSKKTHFSIYKCWIEKYILVFLAKDQTLRNRNDYLCSKILLKTLMAKNF